jgi:ankyrin repeat protein
MATPKKTAVLAYEMKDLIHQHVINGNRPSLLRLLNRGMSVNQPVRDSQDNIFPLLYMASARDHYEVCALLLDKGASVDATVSDGSSSLLIACGMGFLSTVEVLLNGGASVNFSRRDGTTALAFATQRGTIFVVKPLSIVCTDSPVLFAQRFFTHRSIAP